MNTLTEVLVYVNTALMVVYGVLKYINYRKEKHQ